MGSHSGKGVRLFGGGITEQEKDKVSKNRYKTLRENTPVGGKKEIKKERKSEFLL